uniref:Uncharacterized protein n=1 Tax=Anguilla anguilla TaxID=7936 RepID=A0A0E9TV74_ANGAN
MNTITASSNSPVNPSQRFLWQKVGETP